MLLGLRAAYAAHRPEASVALWLLVWLPLLALDMPSPASRMLYVTAVMASLWMHKPIPLVVTSLLPLVMLPVLAVRPAKAVAGSYMSDANMLFLGGFMVAAAVESCGLHRRLATTILLRTAGNRHLLLLGFMLATALLSAFMSNTATAAMQVPLAEGVIRRMASARRRRGAGALASPAWRQIELSSSCGGTGAGGDGGGIGAGHGNGSACAACGAGACKRDKGTTKGYADGEARGEAPLKVPLRVECRTNSEEEEASLDELPRSGATSDISDMSGSKAHAVTDLAVPGAGSNGRAVDAGAALEGAAAAIAAAVRAAPGAPAAAAPAPRAGSIGDAGLHARSDWGTARLHDGDAVGLLGQRHQLSHHPTRDDDDSDDGPRGSAAFQRRAAAAAATARLGGGGWGGWTGYGGSEGLGSPCRGGGGRGEAAGWQGAGVAGSDGWHSHSPLSQPIDSPRLGRPADGGVAGGGGGNGDARRSPRGAVGSCEQAAAGGASFAQEEGEAWQGDGSGASPFALDADTAAFAKSLLLGIAYSSSLGGISTLTGTGPNLVLVGQFAAIFPKAPQLSYFLWAAFALPIVLVLLLVTWTLLVLAEWRRRARARAAGEAPAKRLAVDAASLREELAALGPLSGAERSTLLVLLCTLLAWVTRHPVICAGWDVFFAPGFISDTTVVACATILLFILPGNSQAAHAAAGAARSPSTSPRQPAPHAAPRAEAEAACKSATRAPAARRAEPRLASRASGAPARLLDWETARHIPWDVVLLLGGGFALADGFAASGLSRFLACHLLTSTLVTSVSLPTLLLLVCGSVTAVTEVCSNVATSTIVLPILATLAQALELDPRLLMVPAAISTSLAFMLPVSTPPNAIAFATGRLEVRDMLLPGFVLNVAGVFTIVTAMLLYGWAVLGIAQGEPPAWSVPGGGALASSTC